MAVVVMVVLAAVMVQVAVVTRDIENCTTDIACHL